MDEQYFMAFDDDEEPLGLLRDTEAGTHARHDGRWFTITDTNPYFDGAEIVQVNDEFLDFYDKLDVKGVEPTYKQVQAYAVEEDEESPEDE